MRTIRVISLGGGDAQARILRILLAIRALLSLDGIDLQIGAVVGGADDGGSTGRLRYLFGGPGVGDLINNLAAIAGDSLAAKVFNSRFYHNDEPGLSGHKLGNLFLIQAMSLLQDGLPAAIAMLSRFMGCQVDIYPASLDSPTLCVRLSTGEVITGERNLDEPQYDGNLAITNVWLDPPARLYDGAAEAIQQADKILISPGDPFGSIAAVLQVAGIPQAMAKAKAPIGMFVPLFNRWGQSTGWDAGQHVESVQRLIRPAKLTDAFVDISEESPDLRELYAAARENKVPDCGWDRVEDIHIYRGLYLDETRAEPEKGDAVRRSSLLARHGEGVISDVRDFLLR